MENAHNSQSVFSPNSPTTGAIRHKSRTLPLVLIIITSFATLLVTIFGIILPLINDATHTSRTIMLYMAGSDLESTSGLASATFAPSPDDNTSISELDFTFNTPTFNN